MDENMSSDSASIHSTLQTILTAINGLDTRVQGLDTRVQGLDTRVEGLDTRVQSLTTQVQGLDDQFRGLNSEVRGLVTRLDTLEVEVRQFKLDTTTMWREIGARIDERSSEIRRDLNTFKSRTRYDIAETRRMAREAQDIESQATQSQIDDLDRRMTAIERRMAEKTQE